MDEINHILEYYKFYVCSVGRPGEGYDKENLARCEKYSAHLMANNNQRKGVFKDVAPPAIAILKYDNDFVAYGEIVKKFVDEGNKELGKWDHIVKVEQWIWKDPNDHTKGVHSREINKHVIAGDIYATIKQIDEWGLEKVNEIDNNSDLAKKLNLLDKTNKEMKTYIDLLKSNHNLILTGAPGTGKTYLAKQIAYWMILEKKYEPKKMTDEDKSIFGEHCGFVQFHPSYDYTDFVEGLRPTEPDDSKNIGFKRQDGVFKEFCAKALNELRVDVTDNFEEAWERLLATIKAQNQIEVPCPKRVSMNISLNERGDGIIELQKNGVVSSDSRFAYDKLYRIYKEGESSPSRSHDNYRSAIVEEMKRKYGLKDYNPGKEIYNVERDKPFIMIIDEINRGDISKIFGELFFSIDPEYRGVSGKVKTQYQNLIESGDTFYDGFYVPENVYIIGTMNDIDRSVESMDFAMRRRFAWKEIKAKDTQKMLDDLGDDTKMEGKNKMDTAGIQSAKNRMDNLNNKISDEKEIGLNSAYHIGAAYFMKLANYSGSNNDRFDKLWENHLEGVLREYLRGDEEVDDRDGKEGKITKLKKAFNDENKHDGDK